MLRSKSLKLERYGKKRWGGGDARVVARKQILQGAHRDSHEPKKRDTRNLDEEISSLGVQDEKNGCQEKEN